MASDLIERLRSVGLRFPASPLFYEAADALAMERERAEKAERELRLKAGLVDEAVSAFKGHKAQLQAKLDSAEASLADAKWLLKPFAALADIFDQEAGNRPKTGEICSWVDHRVGERVLTVEMLRAASRFLAQEEARPTEEPQR